MMKKTYVKPEIMFEDFTLCSNIAAACESTVDSQSKGQCAVIGTGNINIFDGTVSACDYDPTDLPGGTTDMYNGFCYHVPTDTSNLFGS